MYLFIWLRAYDLFNDTFNSSNYIGSNDGMVDE